MAHFGFEIKRIEKDHLKELICLIWSKEFRTRHWPSNVKLTVAQSTTLVPEKHQQWFGVTYPEVSSARPPPSLALVWVAERTQLLRLRWLGSTDPELRRSPQSLLRLSSLSKTDALLSQPVNDQDLPTRCPLVTLTTFHLSRTTSPTDRMSVCSAAPLILRVFNLHLASVSRVLH